MQGARRAGCDDPTLMKNSLSPRRFVAKDVLIATTPAL
jgi:hypothetical protein